jgi:hypothetical protein
MNSGLDDNNNNGGINNKPSIIYEFGSIIFYKINSFIGHSNGYISNPSLSPYNGLDGHNLSNPIENSFC